MPETGAPAHHWRLSRRDASLPQVNPQLVELVLWLGSHVHDEARHIEVFTKRSLAGGHHGYALASTELSLSTLLDEHDFTASSLLLNVLGEGTFLDLLRFIETHAPDAAADVRALMQTMERNRLRRLQACGFSTATARHLSDLHTPNLM